MPHSRSPDRRGPAETPANLRRQAAHARRLARSVLDAKAEKALTNLAQELETRAEELEGTSGDARSKCGTDVRHPGR